MLKGILLKKLIGGSFYVIKRREFSGKVKRVYNSLRDRIINPSAELIQKHKQLWSPFNAKVNTKWLSIYTSLSGIDSFKYVPEDIYYTEIEPRLNNKGLSRTYTDKNVYDKILPENYLPVTFVRCINETLFNRNYEKISKNEAIRILNENHQFIIKPSIESGGGRMVKLFKSINGEYFEGECKESIGINDLIKTYSPDFICQEVLINHSFYSQFNQSSLNTVRYLVYKSVKDGKINILNCVFRVGKPGSVVDNQASGGFACGVDNYGSFNGKVVNKLGEDFRFVNGIMIQKGTKLYRYQILKDLALTISSHIYYSHLIGLDLCIDKDGEAKLVEINCYNNEINFFQMTNGPLLGDFTEEIIAYCAGHKRHFIIDFEI